MLEVLKVARVVVDVASLQETIEFKERTPVQELTCFVVR
jgi:hypothetical protein